jgi:hypothetical protein
MAAKAAVPKSGRGGEGAGSALEGGGVLLFVSEAEGRGAGRIQRESPKIPVNTTAMAKPLEIVFRVMGESYSTRPGWQ